jgi:hypothetical protein
MPSLSHSDHDLKYVSSGQGDHGLADWHSLCRMGWYWRLGGGHIGDGLVFRSGNAFEVRVLSLTSYFNYRSKAYLSLG